MGSLILWFLNAMRKALGSTVPQNYSMQRAMYALMHLVTKFSHEYVNIWQL